MPTILMNPGVRNPMRSKFPFSPMRTLGGSTIYFQSDPSQVNRGAQQSLLARQGDINWRRNRILRQEQQRFEQEQLEAELANNLQMGEIENQGLMGVQGLRNQGFLNVTNAEQAGISGRLQQQLGFDRQRLGAEMQDAAADRAMRQMMGLEELDNRLDVQRMRGESDLAVQRQADDAAFQRLGPSLQAELQGRLLSTYGQLGAADIRAGADRYDTDARQRTSQNQMVVDQLMQRESSRLAERLRQMEDTQAGLDRTASQDQFNTEAELRSQLGLLDYDVGMAQAAAQGARNIPQQLTPEQAAMQALQDEINFRREQSLDYGDEFGISPEEQAEIYNQQLELQRYMRGQGPAPQTQSLTPQGNTPVSLPEATRAKNSLLADPTLSAMKVVTPEGNLASPQVIVGALKKWLLRPNARMDPAALQKIGQAILLETQTNPDYSIEGIEPLLQLLNPSGGDTVSEMRRSLSGYEPELSRVNPMNLLFRYPKRAGEQTMRDLMGAPRKRNAPRNRRTNRPPSSFPAGPYMPF